MIQTYLIYGLIICLPIAGYLGYDYGTAKALENAQEAAQAITKLSIEQAKELKTLKESRAKKLVQTIEVVRTVNDETNCLDTVAPIPILDRVRHIQSISN